MENSKRGNGGQEGLEEIVNRINDKYFERLEKNTKYFTSLFKTICICLTIIAVFVVVGMWWKGDEYNVRGSSRVT